MRGKAGIIDFLMGFGGTIVVISFLIWLSANDFNVSDNPLLFTIGILFSMIYSFFVISNSSATSRFGYYLTPRSTSFTKGLMILSAAIMILVFIFILYCIIVPSEYWLWNQN